MNMLKHLTEEDLIKLLHDGNDNATAELLDRYKDKLYTAIYLLVKDRYLAEDIFQEACIKVIHIIRKGSYNEQGKFLPWVLRVARNMSLDFLRKTKKKVLVTLPNGADIFSVLHFENNTENKEDALVREQTKDTLRKLLTYIPYEQREVIVLRMFGNMNFKQIATLTKVSLNTCLGRMRYGLINLRKIIEDKQLVL